ERVEILTRDRDQPSRIVSSRLLERYLDYQLEPFSGRVLFRTPVPSVDENLNPVSIRVTYEVDGATRFPTYGAEGKARVGSRVTVEGSTVRDEFPSGDRQLYGAGATLRLGPGTSLVAEVARSESSSTSSGDAGRLALRHATPRLELTASGV